MPSLKKGNPHHQSLREAAKIEIGLRKFLEEGQFKGFSDTFEDLHGLVQLPGIAAQRLMAEGYGFAAEGDWKTAALVRNYESYGYWFAWRQFLYGRLHVSFRTWKGNGIGQSHAGDMQQYCRWQTFL